MQTATITAGAAKDTRQTLRERFNLEPQPCNDCIVHTCCAPCAGKYLHQAAQWAVLSGARSGLGWQIRRRTADSLCLLLAPAVCQEARELKVRLAPWDHLLWHLPAASLHH